MTDSTLIKPPGLSENFNGVAARVGQMAVGFGLVLVAPATPLLAGMAVAGLGGGLIADAVYGNPVLPRLIAGFAAACRRAYGGIAAKPAELRKSVRNSRPF